MELLKNLARSAFGTMVGAVVVISLVACGGGGGDSPASVPASNAGAVPSQPATSVAVPAKAAGIRYTAFFGDRISPGVVTFDVDGGVVLNSATYTLEVSATSCSFNSAPVDPTAPVCSPLANGEAILFCTNTTGESFDTVFLKSGVVEADISDLLGRTLTAFSCGSPSVRAVSPTIRINTNGSFVEIDGLSTSTTGTGLLTQLTSITGSQYFPFQHRFVVRKIIQGARTTYFLIDLYENVAGTSASRSPKIYIIEL